MLCVECAAPVSSLYTYYSDDNINVTKCDNCGLFVDKYIEGEPILIVIDLLLLRPEAVRHVVFNSTAENTMARAPGSTAGSTPLSRDGSIMLSKEPSPSSIDSRDAPFVRSIDPRDESSRAAAISWRNALPHWSASRWGLPVPIFRLIVLAILFDVYQQWAMCEKSTSPLVQEFLSNKSPVLQYGMFLCLCAVDTFLIHYAVRTMAYYLFEWQDGGAISTGLLIGSFSKLLPILTFIWNYDMPYVAHIVRYAAPFCIIEVLTIIMGHTYLRSVSLALAGVLVSAIIRSLFWLFVELIG